VLLEEQIATTSHDVDSAKHSEKAPIVAITKNPDLPLCTLAGENLCIEMEEYVIARTSQLIRCQDRSHTMRNRILHGSFRVTVLMELRYADVSSLLHRAKMDGTGVTAPFQSGCEGIGVGGEPGEGLENGTVNESEAQAVPALQGDYSGG
jgi:hypothetical protein